MTGFSVIDWIALAAFLFAWVGYDLVLERTGARRHSLNARMAREREIWMRQMMTRDNRIVDSQINGSLQNGTAFFASTSLLAIGGTLALLRSTSEVLTLFEEMPFGLVTTRLAWEMKVVGLVVIFVYAFFKFAWSYRLFNYAAVLIGATPHLKDGITPQSEAAVERAAAMNIVAGRTFNRGQRAFFFALAYLGWFVSAYVFLATTAFALVVMYRRQFASDALAALRHGD